MKQKKSKYNEFIKDVLTLANDKYKMVPEETIQELEIIILVLEEATKTFDRLQKVKE